MNLVRVRDTHLGYISVSQIVDESPYRFRRAKGLMRHRTSMGAGAEVCLRRIGAFADISRLNPSRENSFSS